MRSFAVAFTAALGATSLVAAPLPSPAVAPSSPPHGGVAQHQDHAAHAAPGAAQEVGDAVFAALADVVALLEADPDTDWARVDLDALRDHLVDMHRVTTGARVASAEVDGGLEMTVTGDDPAVAAAVRRMTLAHAGALDRETGWQATAAPSESGAVLTVTAGRAADALRIRGLGFWGLLTVGSHHPAHHLALARGEAPHDR